MKKNLFFLSILVIVCFIGFFACQKKVDDKQQLSIVNTTDKSDATTATPIQIYGAWHAGNDACSWATVRTVTEFDSKNHWLVDRGDGKPSVNLIVLSFVNPLKLLNKTTDS